MAVFYSLQAISLDVKNKILFLISFRLLLACMLSWCLKLIALLLEVHFILSILGIFFLLAGDRDLLQSVVYDAKKTMWFLDDLAKGNNTL